MNSFKYLMFHDISSGQHCKYHEIYMIVYSSGVENFSLAESGIFLRNDKNLLNATSLIFVNKA